MSKIREGLDKAIAHQVQNIVRQNPKGSSAEQILLGKFLGSDQGTYARNVLGKNHKGWIEHITTWLKKNQPKLEKEFNELDFSDLTSLAYDMYENYLAKQGQLEEGNAPPKVLFNPKPIQKGPDEYEYTEYIPRGREDKEAWAIKRTVDKQKLPNKKPKELNTGFYKNYLGNRPVREDEVEENLLKTYGDQWDLDEGKAEVRAELDQAIKDFLAKGGQIEKLKPNKVRAKPGMGLASKHIGTSGEVARKVRSRFLLGKGRNLTGIKPEVKIEGTSSEAKMVNANDPTSDGWRWANIKPSGILEGIITEYDTKTIDSVVQSLPKGLTVNNFTHPAFKEYLYQKYYGPMKAGWDKLWPFFSKEYNEKHGIKEYKQNPHQILSGDVNFFDDMLIVIPKGLKSNELYTQAFKEFLYKKFGNKEWTDFKKNRFAYWDAYQKIGGSKPQGIFNKLKSKIGLDEDATADQFYQEFVNSKYNPNSPSYLDTLQGLKQFLLSKNLPADVLKFVLRKLIQKVKPELEEEKVDELKCWTGYKRVPGTKAGEKGSCTKAESAIIKGLQTDENINEYELDSSRKIEFNKENPPAFDYLYRQFIHNMLSSTGNINPQDWINAANNRYGLSYTYKDYQNFGKNRDNTGGWDKFIKKYILNK